ncbi:hypothetical protein GCM10011573_35910 [Enterococcus wangshanyuanii]|uniref:TMhelix containing protein n=1 Tax=Enterococcus wangshanyuanii TaxID=2005703 RepID=A0ABQ1PT12_9ENTE|nr:hypothetical protein GCM10011573_35910 [Enterococcus wangshanyuanii]
MIISNCVLSLIGGVLSIIGTCSSNDNLECFGWGMILVTFVNTVGYTIGCLKKEMRNK